MDTKNSFWLKKGIHDGIPIALGYLSVGFTLGITARHAGLTPFQATITSLFMNASAGEFAGFTMISGKAGYVEAGIMMLIINARYLLMSCALSQKLGSSASVLHRMLMGYDVTDELFGASILVPGKLDPCYYYGMMLISMPGWAAGTCLGVVAGNALSEGLVSALGVGLYGMFLAVIVPPAARERVLGVLIAVSMAASYAMSILCSGISPGTRIMALTVIIAGAASILFPIKEERENGA